MGISRCVLGILLVLVLLRARPLTGDDRETLMSIARQYRIQTYDRFRNDRRELDRRLRASQSLLDDWQDRDAPEDEIPDIILWFQRATHATRSAQPVPLPAYTVKPRRPKSASQGLQTPVTPVPSREKPPQTGTRVHGETRPLVEPNFSRTAPRAATADGDRPDDLAPLNPSDLSPERSPSPNLQRTAPLPTVRLQASLRNSESLVSRSIKAAPATSVDEHAALTRSPKRHSDVDLEMLAAKIRSLNLSLTAVESELANDVDWEIGELEAVTSELTHLFTQVNLARLYYDAIPYEQQELIEPIVDVGPLQAMLAQRTFELRIRLTEVLRKNESGDAIQQMDRLERVSEVVQQWTSNQ